MIIKPHGIEDLDFAFFNQEAFDWYYPLKSYTVLEYEWVRDNVILTQNTVVIDAGCHHGNYAVVFKPAYVIAIDNVVANLRFCKTNVILNGIKGEYIFKHIGSSGCGVTTTKKVTVYKVDIEGSEFELFPDELARFPTVTTWIIEIHPAQGDPNLIATLFHESGFELLKVDREALRVRKYELGEKWMTHATLIARKAAK